MPVEQAVKKAYEATHNLWVTADRTKLSWAEVAYILGFIGKAEFKAYTQTR